jgi:hypothetical protein
MSSAERGDRVILINSQTASWRTRQLHRVLEAAFNQDLRVRVTDSGMLTISGRRDRCDPLRFFKDSVVPQKRLS